MPLFYITGISGSGKSATLHELRARGFEAHGVDEDGLADWIRRDTGRIAQFPHGAKDFNIHKWYKEHHWILNTQKVKQFKQQADATSKAIFLCGVTAGDKQAWDYFDKIVALTTDTNTIKQRITTRTNNEFGKAPEELQEILHWHATTYADYKKRGALLIETNKPVTAVVDKIVKELKISSK